MVTYMKKYGKLLILAALVLSLIVLAGCSAEQVLQNIGSQLQSDHEEEAAATPVPPAATPVPDAAPASAAPAATEVPVEVPAAMTATPSDAGAAPSGTATPSDAQTTPAPQTIPTEPASTDFTKLSAAACVEDIGKEPGQLPRIVLDCPGAASINEDIEGTFGYLLEGDYCSLYYNVAKGADRILSVLIVQQYDSGDAYYTPYNLDLSTGERVDGDKLLSILGIDGHILADDELSIMGGEFELNYGGQKDGELAAIYEEQYNRTVAPENADLNRLWFYDSHSLYFVAKIYSLAGAEFYEYPMDTGLRF